VGSRPEPNPGVSPGPAPDRDPRSGALLASLAGGCDAADTPPSSAPESSPALEAAHADEGSRALAPEQEAFWAALLAHCGNAYEGQVSDVTPYYADGLVGRRAVIHFLDCSEDRIHVPFHLDDNRSRNWIVTREGGTLRLKHDHRNPDGTEEAISQYGGDAPTPGLATRQIFPADGTPQTSFPTGPTTSGSSTSSTSTASVRRALAPAGALGALQLRPLEHGRDASASVGIRAGPTEPG
jgi:hypothetical protein